MRRRSFLKASLGSLSMGLGAPSLRAQDDGAIRIRRIRYYRPPGARPTFNQSQNIIVVETDSGITGIGEGGTPDMLEQAGAMLIGEDARKISHLWQLMYRGYFYPPGREKLHALGGLDMALWDIRAKSLDVPLYELLGGPARNYIECYSTAFPRQGSLKETAAACMEAGFRAYRTSVSGPRPGEDFISVRAVDDTVRACRQIREGVGADGDWAIDYHTRLDFPDAVRLSQLIEDLEPFFAEDLVRSENPGVYRTLREKVHLPIAVGEHFGDRWEINELIEEHLIDYSRVTLPNAGGVTEFVKLAALCETHYVGMVPHFTGPVATAALVHVLAAFPGPVLMEILGAEPAETPHLPESFDFREGKLWPNRRPGLGVEFDAARAELLTEVTEASQPIPTYRRPDGSYTNW